MEDCDRSRCACRLRARRPETDRKVASRKERPVTEKTTVVIAVMEAAARSAAAGTAQDVTVVDG